MKTNKFLESEVFLKLENNRDLYSPLKILEVINESLGLMDKGIDGFIRLDFKGKTLELMFEIKNRTAPQVITNGINNLRLLKSKNESNNYLPTLLVPYLSASVVDLLEKNELCGLDLNGNYYIVTPDFVAIRLDNPNEFKESFSIKDIYSRNSSIVSRFLLKNNTPYRKVSEIFEGIKASGGSITLSTVSKVLKNLEEQLIIYRDPLIISLIQRDKLLLNLKNNYIPPIPLKILKLNLPHNWLDAQMILNECFGDDWILSGESSAEFYAATTSAIEYTIYAKNFYVSEGILSKYEDKRFFNFTIAILPPSADYVFFDSHDNKASKIQSYLELSHLDKREKEIAKDIEKDILNGFRR